MAADDEALLEEELNQSEQVFQHGHFRSRRWYERSAGGNVMLVWSCLLWLVLLAVTMKFVESAKDLAAVALLGLMGLEGLLAIFLSRLIWRAIGARPRQVIRFAARFWFVVLPLSCVVTARAAGPLLASIERERRIASGATPEQVSAGVVGAVQGANWQMVLGPGQGYASASHAEAVRACAALGEGFKLPRVDELATLDPIPRAPEATAFWLAELESQSRRFHLESKARKREKGPAFSLLMTGPVEPQSAAILCVHPARLAPLPTPSAAPAPRHVSPAVTFAGLVKQEISCRRDAAAAARSDGAAQGERLARALTCWAEASAALEAHERFAPPLNELPSGATAEERISSALQSVSPPSDALLSMLSAGVQEEVQVAELSFWRWARAHPKEAGAQTSVLLSKAEELDQRNEPATRLAHALAVAGGAPPACELLAERALSGSWPNNLATEALRDVRGACAVAAARVLHEHQRTKGFSKNLKYVDASSSLGAAAAAQVREGEKVRGTDCEYNSWSQVWEALLSSELVRRHGVLPPRGGRSLVLPGLPPLGLVTRACTQADFGLSPKEPLPYEDDRCVKHLDPAPLAALREGFVPLRPSVDGP